MDHGSAHPAGHHAIPRAEPMLEVERRAGSLDLPILADLNPDPHVVEVNLRAMTAEVAYLPGKPVTAWTYEGRIPGPMLKANVGDRVIVHFTNQLPEATTIHWHGIRVPNAMDGVTAVMSPVPPGGTFTYDFVVPDAGAFWFHPHVRSDVQVERGLYAPFVVTDPAEPALSSTQDVVLLDDVSIDSVSGQPRGGHDARTEMMGREGNFILVNGGPANLVVPTDVGQARRWRIVNVANARFFRLAFHNGRMVQVGGDGGLLETPRELSEILVVPGERVDLIVWPTPSAAEASLRSLPYERAVGAGATTPLELIHLPGAPTAPATAPALPDALRPPLPPPPATGITRRVRLGERMSHGGFAFTINDQISPNVTVLDATRGTSEIWDVVNEADMDHPLHVHGFFFRPPGGAERKDTINIPARKTVRLVLEIDSRAGAAGHWMYHCHILEHAERGMMGEMRVR